MSSEAMRRSERGGSVERSRRTDRRRGGGDPGCGSFPPGPLAGTPTAKNC
jgi:hypothetical protein